MFEKPDMPDAQFIEEMDAMIPDMYDVPGGSPPSDPEHGSLPASQRGGGSGGQAVPGSKQSGGQPGDDAAAAAVQPEAVKQVVSLLCSVVIISICSAL
jgi:hypothetical protein